MIDLIVFDLAGTTVKENFDVQRVLKNSFEKVGLSISIEQANKVMGIPKPVAILQLLESLHYPNISEEFIRQIHVDFVSNMISFYQNDSTVEENAGVSETFRVLKKHGIKVMVDTGFDRPIVNSLLIRMAWLENGLIDGSITSDEVPNGRPHPDMIYKAMQMSGVTDVKRVAKVGDTLSDLGEGNSAGCGFVVGITSGSFTREQLAALPHTHIIQHIPEILKIVGIEN
ncbi:MAG: HAD hydrolase-like protein [Bacteroidetes bacterium]|nr:HAD hydrolase-like protein [Bacteroidota bacterium]